MANNAGDMDMILQSCLNLIHGGQEELASVLSCCPDEASELRPLLEVAVWLWSCRAAFDPSPGFVSASRRRLVSMIQ